MITVVDYEAGNLTSVESALRYLGADFQVTKDPDVVRQSERVLFPGVGEARQAMGVLNQTGLGSALQEFAQTGRPLMGICLGCQILLEHSEERDTPLLGILPGKVKRFAPREGFKVPQIGWNTVSHEGQGMFSSLPPHASFYFVHSYHIPEIDAGSIHPHMTGRCEYGVPFVAALAKDNVWAAQFHPEKSGPIGLKLLKNFIDKAD